MFFCDLHAECDLHAKLIRFTYLHIWKVYSFSLLCDCIIPRHCSNSCSSSQCCHPTTSSSVVPFSSCLQSFPASFPMSWLFASGGQSIGASASASVLPMNIQDWFPLGLTGLISLLSKELPSVFSKTAVWRYQSFSAQHSLWSNCHIQILLEKQ